MATRVVTTKIAIDGEQEFKRQMGLVNGELKTLKAEMGLLDAEFKGQANSVDYLTEKDKLLRREQEQQMEKVRALEEAVADATAAYGEADSRTDKYRQQLVRAKTELANLSYEVNRNADLLEEASNSADGCAHSIDGLGREAKDAKKNVDGLDDDLRDVADAADDLDDAGGGSGLGNLVSSLGSVKSVLAGGAVVGAVKAVVGAIDEVVESTAEYRQIMGALEVSSAAAGYSAEETREAYLKLKGVLADTQTAATATANLQALGLAQGTLNLLIDECIGAWATYGDSIPIDGLSESINETIQAGKVTGTFADVLNWAGINEDDFNESLAATADMADRATLVLETMAKNGLAETGREYQKLNEDLIAVNQAQERFDEAMAGLGERLAPVAASFKAFSTDVVSVLTDIFDAAASVIDKLKEIKIDGNPQQYGSGTAEDHVRGGQTGWSVLWPFSGSHAGGLDYVPYDGYLAELHKGETVLTASEAKTLRSLLQSPMSVRSGASAGDVQNAVAEAVNALVSVQGAQAPQSATITIVTRDGIEIARAFVPDIRKAMDETPEVSDG